MSQRSTTFRYTRKMVFLGIVFVPLAPYLLALAVAYTFFINSLANGSHSTMERIVQSQARFIDRYLAERMADLAFVLESVPAAELADPAVLARVFAQLREQSAVFVDLGLIDHQGRHLAYIGPYQLLDKNYAGAEWFRATLAKGQFVSDVFLGFRGTPHCVLARASRTESPVILRATIDSDAFSRVVEEVRVGETGEAFLLNEKGQYQTRHPGSWDLLDTAPASEDFLGPVYGVRTFIHRSSQGDRYLAAVASVNNGRWKLVARQEIRDAYGAVYRAAVWILAVSLVGGLATISLALVASQRIGSTLEEIDSEKEHLRDRLYRSVRLAELGEMTASFAHEINNPLQIMKSELTLLTMLLAESEQAGSPLADTVRQEVHDNLDQILLQINRCSEITSSILRFGRKEPAAATRIDLNDLLRDISAMVARKAETRGIDLVRSVDPATPLILGDASKLQQIFLNLLNNAIYAIVEQHGNHGGRLEIIARANGQGGALVQVRDNGTGIPKEVLANIYTPFFTTKPPEKGTGLGLAVCYGLVESMGGTIDLNTREGEGTVFCVHLPAA